MENFRVTRVKIILLLSSLACLVLLVIAALQENLLSEWRGYQRDYATVLAEQSSDGTSSTAFTVEPRQLFLADLGRIDRCVTCHVGIDNPSMKGQPNPLAVHPGDLLEHHPPDKFGCTICHQGQGRATVSADAHGDSPHWPKPLLRGELVYTSCSRCHYENDLYGGEADLYGQNKPVEFIRRGELNAQVPGSDNIARGKKLVLEKGCLGCHKYRARGGSIGPDITHVGDKTVHDFDFTHVQGDHTVLNWLVTHFKSPKSVTPGTLMPELGLSDHQAGDLAQYMISLKQKNAPAEYTPLPRPVDPTPVRGETLYAAYCSACHGRDGVGAIVRNSEEAKAIDRARELLTPSLRNIDTLGVSSDAYLRSIVHHGRRGTSMPAWGEDGGLSSDEIDLIVGYIRGWEPRAADQSYISASRGEAHYGAALFRANCAACHGNEGQGGEIGISLRSSTFQSIADDAFIAETILHGRSNTAMPSWKEFDNREVSDLLAFIRQWQPLRSERNEVLASKVIASIDPPPDSVATGLKFYRSRCAVCHGDNGKGKIGPSLNNQSVLQVVSNEFLHDTIVKGRPGTAMPAWRQLGSLDVADIIALLRSWQTEPNRELEPISVAGDWQYGAILFQGMCASCHGPNAEGSIGPQLSNPVFLASVSDETLFQWIGYGRQGTQMRPFLKGEQGIVGLSKPQIVDIITYIRSLRSQRSIRGQQIGLGFAPRGDVLYHRMCVGCHGPEGGGATGPAIRNPDFLAAVSDGFLRATIVLGRAGTEMRSMGHGGAGIVELRSEQINDLVAYLRSAKSSQAITHKFVIGADPQRGHILFGRYCVGCHGTNGVKGFAPELNNAGFLHAATDGYLQATITRGRRGTAMRPFGKGRSGVAELPQRDINDIVSFIRQWSPDTRPLLRTEPFAEVWHALAGSPREKSLSSLRTTAGTNGGGGE